MRNLVYEDNIKKVIVEYLSASPFYKDYFCSVFNEGKRSSKVNYKAKGLVKGVSDLLITRPSEVHVGLWLELKREKKSKKTEEQTQWLDNHASLGWGTAFAYGLDDALNILNDYKNNKLIHRR